MLLRNPSAHAIEAYRDSGEGSAMCKVPACRATPLVWEGVLMRRRKLHSRLWDWWGWYAAALSKPA